MFEFGRKYTLTFLQTHDNSTQTSVEASMEVVSVEIPLVKFEKAGRQVIVNVSSPAFLKGERES